MQAERKRPTGVTIIAILTIISICLALINAVYFITTGPYLKAISQAYSQAFAMAGWTWYLTISGIFGTMMLAFAIAFSISAWGVFHGKGWARIFGLMLSTGAIILSIFMIMIVAFGIVEFIKDTIATIVGTIVNGVIIWLLFRPKVKEYF